MKKTIKILLILFLVAALIKGGEAGFKMLYPVRYEDSINRYSKEYNVDPYLVMSIIKAESNFKSDAVSSKDATGLMQITKETAEWIAQKLEIEEFDYENDILNPEININMGSYYINYLKDMYDGRVDCALAAYNAGFRNVDEWLKTSEYSKDGQNLDSIPFPETDRYVDKVKNNYKMYKLLYKDTV